LADESYLCIGEHATGFDFNKTNYTWEIVKFEARKWIIKRADPKHKWEVFEFGEKNPVALCRRFHKGWVFEV
jgi:hypothetical protein